MRALRIKSGFADYVTTQMCFGPAAVDSWLTRERERRMDLPVLIGFPGKVDRRRLLEMSVRIGVGPSRRVRPQATGHPRAALASFGGRPAS